MDVWLDGRDVCVFVWFLCISPCIYPNYVGSSWTIQCYCEKRNIEDVGNDLGTLSEWLYCTMKPHYNTQR